MQDPAATTLPEAPSYIANALLRCGLHLRNVPGKRFGVFASKAFAAGSSILNEEPAACCVSRNVHKSPHRDAKGAVAPVACAQCMRDDSALMKCAACGIAHYCCKEHQVSHWPRHKTTCSRFKKIAKEELQQPEWLHHYSVMRLVSELIDSVNATGVARSCASAVSPGHNDIMFLCTTPVSPAASAVTSALTRIVGDAPSACECAVFLSCFAFILLLQHCDLAQHVFHHAHFLVSSMQAASICSALLATLSPFCLQQVT